MSDTLKELCRRSLTVGDKTYDYFSLAALAEKVPAINRLPYSLKVLLENLLRNEDGVSVTADDINALAAELTACEAIALWAKTRGFSPTQSDLYKAFETLNLSICMHQPVRVLSAGQRRRGGMVRLALMQAMSAPVPLWLLDEPTTAMDDSAVHVFAEMLDLHADQGGAVLMTSHLDLPLKNSMNVMLSDLEVRS